MCTCTCIYVYVHVSEYAVIRLSSILEELVQPVFANSLLMWSLTDISTHNGLCIWPGLVYLAPT